jgi:hypothetical protein
VRLHEKRFHTISNVHVSMNICFVTLTSGKEEIKIYIHHLQHYNKRYLSVQTSFFVQMSYVYIYHYLVIDKCYKNGNIMMGGNGQNEMRTL